MAAEQLKSVADRLVAHCREHTELQGLKELYDPDAVSIEAAPMPGTDSPETRGVEGIKGKHEWWNANFETHSGSVDGPYLHGQDRFAVIFEMDTTHKESGERHQMKEVGIYTVNDGGKITREEFFYTM